MQAMPPQPGFDSSGVEDAQQQPQAQSAGIPVQGEYMLPHTQLELGHSMASQPRPYGGYVDTTPFYNSMMAAYGQQAMMHPQMLGVQQARMPLPSEMLEEEPVYVNAKQYHGILRRRQSRAKAESENKLIKSRKPYLHESRHLHALRRARGCGGRFLNTKSKEDSKAENHRSTEGQSSEGTNISDAQASHSSQGLMSSTQNLQDGGMNGVTSMQQMGEYHAGILTHAGHVGMISGNSGGAYHNHHQPQAFHSSAFHPLPGGENGSDSAQSGSTVVATQ